MVCTSSAAFTVGTHSTAHTAAQLAAAAAGAVAAVCAGADAPLWPPPLRKHCWAQVQPEAVALSSSAAPAALAGCAAVPQPAAPTLYSPRQAAAGLAQGPAEVPEGTLVVQALATQAAG